MTTLRDDVVHAPLSLSRSVNKRAPFSRAVLEVCDDDGKKGTLYLTVERRCRRRRSTIVFSSFCLIESPFLHLFFVGKTEGDGEERKKIKKKDREKKIEKKEDVYLGFGIFFLSPFLDFSLSEVDTSKSLLLS